jgi:hypothetical protein
MRFFFIFKYRGINIKKYYFSKTLLHILINRENNMINEVLGIVSSLLTNRVMCQCARDELKGGEISLGKRSWRATFSDPGFIF